MKSLERTESVEMDYFQAQFLLTLPAAGYYTLRIEASLLDDEGRVWRTGHEAAMTVLAETEENLRLHQRQREAAASSTSNKAGLGHSHSRNQ